MKCVHRKHWLQVITASMSTHELQLIPDSCIIILMKSSLLIKASVLPKAGMINVEVARVGQSPYSKSYRKPVGQAPRELSCLACAIYFLMWWVGRFQHLILVSLEKSGNTGPGIPPGTIRLPLLVSLAQPGPRLFKFAISALWDFRAIFKDIFNVMSKKWLITALKNDLKMNRGNIWKWTASRFHRCYRKGSLISSNRFAKPVKMI